MISDLVLAASWAAPQRLHLLATKLTHCTRRSITLALGRSRPLVHKGLVKMNYIYSWEMSDVVEARRLANELAEAEQVASAHIAASRIRRCAIIALREREENHGSGEKKTDAQGSTADPTPDDCLVEVAPEIVDQLIQQTWNGIQAQQGKLVGRLVIEIMFQLEL